MEAGCATRAYFFTCIPSSFNCASLTGVGASTIRSTARAVLGRNYFTQTLGACQDHHNAIQSQRDATVRRRAVLQRFQEKAETGAGLFLRHAQKR